MKRVIYSLVVLTLLCSFIFKANSTCFDNAVYEQIYYVIQNNGILQEIAGLTNIKTPKLFVVDTIVRPKLVYSNYIHSSKFLDDKYSYLYGEKYFTNHFNSQIRDIIYQQILNITRKDIEQNACKDTIILRNLPSAMSSTIDSCSLALWFMPSYEKYCCVYIIPLYGQKFSMFNIGGIFFRVILKIDNNQIIVIDKSQLTT